MTAQVSTERRAAAAASCWECSEAELLERKVCAASISVSALNFPGVAQVPIWILVIGGAGIVAGLATFGCVAAGVLGELD